MRKVIVVVRRHPSPERLLDPPAAFAGYEVNLPVEPAGDVDAVVSLHLDRDDEDLAARFAPASITAYAVDERRQWDDTRDWPLGAPSPGVKRISFVSTLPTMTRDAFAAHWTDDHAPLARRHHPALWRYTQNVVIEPLTAGAPGVDGIAELSFRTRADLDERMYDSDEGRAIIGADVRTFIDLAAGWRVLCREHVVVPPPPVTPRWPART